MLSGETAADDIQYVTLKEAMEKDWVKIIETSDVNELMITNNSDKTIFIHAGDIVKGGKQDRVLAYDMIIEPNAKKQKLSSFCVEAGRWNQRGEEDSYAFESTTKMLTSRDLKIASKKDNEQGEVWSEVAEQQNKLSENTSYFAQKEVDVKNAESESSLELTLDNKELAAIQEKYKSVFKDLATKNTLGFGYAINGELYNVDFYNNRELFLELYDKLLTAAIVEAIADLNTKETEYRRMTLAEFKDALTMSEDFDESAKNLNKRTRWISKEDDDKVIFTSQDRENKDTWVHKNLIIKVAQDAEVDAYDVPVQQLSYENANEETNENVNNANQE
jgi:hypothetical protein